MVQYHLGADWDSEKMSSKNIIATILSSRWYKWLSEMVLNYCGKNIIVNPCDSDWNPAGYIDHQSTDILDDWWHDDEIEFKKSMKEFIFNSKYGFVTDNDNH
jgi:hypothetical protein